MTNHWKIVLIFFFLSSMVFSDVRAADATKIGLVDFQKILDESNAGKAAQAEITRKGESMEAEIRKMGEEVESLKNNLEREALVMSREARDEKERELRVKITDLRALQNKHVQTFKETERNLVQQIQKEVTDLINEVAAREGYQLILERREGGVVYFLNTMDLTDRIINMYNQKKR